MRREVGIEVHELAGVEAEPGGLEQAERGDVLGGDEGVEGAGAIDLKEEGQSSGGDALSPEGTAEPVADVACAVVRERGDVPGEIMAREDGSLDDPGVIEDAMPVVFEGEAVARGEGGLCGGFGVGLVGVECREISEEDGAEGDVN